MNLIILFLILFFPSISFAEGTFFNIRIAPKEKFNIAKEVYAIFPLSNKENVDIEIKNNRGSFSVRYQSNLIIQALHKDGSITSYRVEVRKRQNTTLYGLYQKKGYHVFFNTQYTDQNPQRLVNRLSSNLNLYTNVGQNSSFYGFIRYFENQALSYYAKYDYKDFFINYGDKSAPFSRMNSRIIANPLIRRIGFGYDNKVFNYEIWKGQVSPLNSNLGSFRGGIGEPGELQRNINENSYTGFYFGYNINSKLFLDSSGWRDSLGISNTYVSGNYIYSREQKYRIGLGGNQNSPLFNIGLNYISNKPGFRLRSLDFNYELAKNGVDNMLIRNNLPLETAGLSLQFNSNQKNQDAGGFFIGQKINYQLLGFDQIYSTSSSFGWSNSKVKLGVNYSESEILRTTSQVNNSTESFSPFFSIFFKKSKSTTTLNLSQNYSKIISSPYEINRQESVVGVNYKYSSFFKIGLNVGRTFLDGLNRRTDGTRLSPFVEIHGDRLRFSMDYNQYFFNDPGDSESSLGQKRINSKITWQLNENQSFYGNFMSVEDGFIGRQYSVYVLGYNFRIGDNSKSLFGFLDKRKLRIKIFHDSEFSETISEKYEGIKGVEIIVIDAKGAAHKAITDQNGIAELSGFETPAQVTYKSEKILLKGLEKIDSDFSKIEYEIPGYFVKFKKISIKSKKNVDFFIRNVCKGKEVSEEIVSSNIDKNIYLVESEQCSILVDNSMMRNSVIVPEKIQTTKSDFNFEAQFSKTLLIQVFKDLNKDGLYSLGEEVANQEIVFKEKKFKTDENGVISQTIEDLDSLTFVEVKNKKCKILNSKNKNLLFLNGMISILCQ